MKILIAVSNQEFSAPTLSIGMKVSSAFNASVTILKVGPRISEFSTSHVKLTRNIMEKWDFDIPGVDVLEWAFNFLCSNNYIKHQSIKSGFSKNTLVEKESNRIQLYLQGTAGTDVNLILRNGDIITELRDEILKGDFAVTIIGGSQKRRMAHDLIQYLDSSIFLVNKYTDKKPYRLLIAINNSARSQKVVKYGVRISQAFNIPIDLLTVLKPKFSNKSSLKYFYKAEKFFRRIGVKYKPHILTGDPVTLIKETAGDNHIVIMRSSQKNPILKFFKGSKPLKIMEDSSFPILIIK